MKFLNAILTFFGVKREPTIQNIIRPMSRIVAQLDKFSAEQTACACSAREAAERQLKESAEREAAAREAADLAKRYSTLTAI